MHVYKKKSVLAFPGCVKKRDEKRRLLAEWPKYQSVDWEREKGREGKCEEGD